MSGVSLKPRNSWNLKAPHLQAPEEQISEWTGLFMSAEPLPPAPELNQCVRLRPPFGLARCMFSGSIETNSGQSYQRTMYEHSTLLADLKELSALLTYQGLDR